MSATLEEASITSMRTIARGVPVGNTKRAEEICMDLLNSLHKNNTLHGTTTRTIKRKYYSPRLKFDAGRMF